MSEASGRGKVVQRLPLCSSECRQLLQQALDLLPQEEEKEETRHNFVLTFAGGRFADSSSDDDEEDNGGKNEAGNTSDASESRSVSDNDEQADRNDNKPTNNATKNDAPPAASKPPKQQQARAKKIDPRQHEANIRKHWETLPCHTVPVPSQQQLLHFSSSLLSKEERWNSRHGNSPRSAVQSILDLSIQIDQHQRPVVVLFVRSGRFAGAVFGTNGQCIKHKTSVRYTVRKGQGKAQSAQDNAKGKPKSVGSQLRRAGEEALQNDIAQTLREWKVDLGTAALIWVSCPKTMQGSLFGGGSSDNANAESLLKRDDTRIRRVPLDLGRPTYENAVLIHDVLMTVTLREAVEEETSTVAATTEPLDTISEAVQAEEKAPEEQQQQEPAKTKEDSIVALSALHVAAKNGDLAVVRDLIERHSGTEHNENDGEGLDHAAGEDFMTPLHYAAASTLHGVEPSVAAQVVTELLVVGKADPVRVDARNRPAYFLAAHEKVRDAFRVARACLGEDAWDWEEAKVGPPLSQQDLQDRKEKEADKKKKKKARQKEKKAKERAQQQELEEQRKAQAQEAEQAQEAKRIRDGLQPKPNKDATNVCDFCQKQVKGRQRSQMYKRLEYAYCSTDCVQKHKRELMASAALQRFQN